VVFIAGCTGAPVPVSERDVSDYRKQPPSSQSAPTSTPSAATVAKPAVAAPPSAPAPSVATAAPSRTPAEPREEGDWRPESYTVKRGDTLYTIALDHGLDYKELASWNQLADANMIKVGQSLRLRAPPGWKAESTEANEVISKPLPAVSPVELQVLEPPPAPKMQPKGVKLPYSEDALAGLMRDPSSAPGAEVKTPPLNAAPTPQEPKPPVEVKAPSRAQTATEAKPVDEAKPAPAPVKIEPVAAKPPGKVDDFVPDQMLQWVWPASGKLVHGFSQGSNPKGIAIRGTPGQSVFATAAGKVVYSGSGLRGYGKLVIIKHNNTYLSVYAHNRELLVKEGERVTKGQKIAEMGGTSADGVALHFEIRRLGKPVDPLKFLPQEGA
jgi:lipoprotein NlpD